MFNTIISSHSAQVSFVPKIEKFTDEPWVLFGANKQIFEKWIPEICGICCLKMIGDSYNTTKEITLYSLTIECESLGGYKNDAGQIRGVFHYPLLHLAQQHKLRGFVAKKLSICNIIDQISRKRFVILSIDLQKISKGLSGSHLILVHGYNFNKQCFIVHDCSHAIATNGEGVELSNVIMNKISNNKGIVIWK